MFYDGMFYDGMFYDGMLYDGMFYDGMLYVSMFQVLDQEGVPELHGPVLWLEQEQGGVHHRSKQEPKENTYQKNRYKKNL